MVPTSSQYNKDFVNHGEVGTWIYGKYKAPSIRGSYPHDGFIRQSGYSLGEGNGDGDRLGYTDEPVVALLEIGTGAGSRVEAEVELRLAKTAAVVDGVFNAGGRIKLSDWRS